MDDGKEPIYHELNGEKWHFKYTFLLKDNKEISGRSARYINYAHLPECEHDPVKHAKILEVPGYYALDALLVKISEVVAIHCVLVKYDYMTSEEQNHFTFLAAQKTLHYGL